MSVGDIMGPPCSRLRYNYDIKNSNVKSTRPSSAPDGPVPRHLHQIGHDAPARWNGPIAVEIMSKDVIKLDRFGYPRDVIDTPNPSRQRREIREAFPADPKQRRVDCVEPHQSCEYQDIGNRHRAAEQ